MKKKNKINVGIMAAFENAGVNVSADDEYIHISYYCEHGQEQDEEIPRNVKSVADFLEESYESWDCSEKTIIWLDEFGHGKNGAPYDMADVLADNQEWERKLKELSEIASRYENK